MFLTEEEVVDNFISNMMFLGPKKDKEIAYIKSITREDMIEFHSGVGTYIRNEYKLWDPECPLTKEWHDLRKHDNTTLIKHGIDCHPKHPDEVSMNILYMIWDKVQQLEV